MNNDLIVQSIHSKHPTGFNDIHSPPAESHIHNCVCVCASHTYSHVYACHRYKEVTSLHTSACKLEWTCTSACRLEWTCTSACRLEWTCTSACKLYMYIQLVIFVRVKRNNVWTICICGTRLQASITCLRHWVVTNPLGKQLEINVLLVCTLIAQHH